MTVNYGKANAWFPNLMKVMSGYEAVKPVEHNWPRPALAWALQQHHEFMLWRAYKDRQVSKRTDAWPRAIPVDHWPGLPDLKLTAWALLGQYRLAHRQKPVPNPYPSPSSGPLFKLAANPAADRVMHYFYTAGNFTAGADALIRIDQQVRAAGRYKGIAVTLYVQDALKPASDSGNPHELYVPPGWIEKLRAAGIPVFGSGWYLPDGDVMRAQIDLLKSLAVPFDGWIANNEAGWGFEDWRGAWPTTMFEGKETDVSEAFCRCYTEAGVGKPLGIATTWGTQLHLKHWADTGLLIEVEPEAYEADKSGPDLSYETIDTSIEHACQRQGEGSLPVAGARPLVAWYANQDPERYRPQVAKARTRFGDGVLFGTWASEYGSEEQLLRFSLL